MREISLDTETTGFKPTDGHRLVEIGCVELINRIPTGNVFHKYINPQRDMPEPAFNVHGLSEEFLSDKPLFKDIADEFLEFIGDSRLIIHNAQFDMAFLNAELTWAKKKEIPYAQTFCTLQEARSRFPGSPASLDALCKRFNVDNSAREKHGALLDAEILAEMYLELMGGSQVALELGGQSSSSSISSGVENLKREETLEARSFPPSEDDLKNHQEFLKKINEPAWHA